MIVKRLRKYAADARTFPRDAAGAWRAGGAESVWIEFRRRTVDRVVGYARMLVVETDISNLPVAPAADGVQIRRFAGPDWSSLGDLVGARLAQRFALAMAAGRLCLVAWRGGRAVGYIWLSPRVETGYEKLELPLPPDAIYGWQLQVARDERRRRVGAALLGAGFQLAKELGYCRSWGVIHPRNVASLRTTASVGPTRVLGTVSRVKLLSWMRSRYRELRSPYPVEAGAQG